METNITVTDWTPGDTHKLTITVTIDGVVTSGSATVAKGNKVKLDAALAALPCAEDVRRLASGHVDPGEYRRLNFGA